MVKKCPSCGYNNRDDASFCSSCGASLGGQMAPSLKPVPSVRVVTPVSPGGPIRVPAPGQCFYHPNLPAVYVCNRCGRAICRDDSKAYMDLVLCPQCYAGVVPMTAAQPQMQAARCSHKCKLRCRQLWERRFQDQLLDRHLWQLKLLVHRRFRQLSYNPLHQEHCGDSYSP